MGSTPSTPDLTIEPGAWALLVGNQLKHLRSTLGGASSEARKRAVEDHVRRALGTVPLEQRAACLAALSREFPIARKSTFLPLPEEAKPAQNDEQIIEAFLRIASNLPEKDREMLRGRLAEAGIVSSGGGIDGEALSEMQTKLKLGPTEQIDSQRLGKLFASVTEAMLMLDHLVWNFWRAVAPKSAIRRDMPSTELRLLVRRSVTGDAEASAAQVQKQFEATRQLIAGLLAALGPAGKNFARRYLDRYSPDAVRAAVKAEGGLFANSDARLWKKYTELAVDITEESIDGDVQTAVIKYTEDLIHGPKR